MIRGRRGIVVVLFLILSFGLLGQPASAWELGMTATVPLSSTWKELLEQNSTAVLNTRSHRNIAVLTVQVKGTDSVTIPRQTVQALLFQNMTLTDNQVKATDEKGNLEFTFVYKLGEDYRIILVDDPDQSPFVLKTIVF